MTSTVPPNARLAGRGGATLAASSSSSPESSVSETTAAASGMPLSRKAAAAAAGPVPGRGPSSASSWSSPRPPSLAGSPQEAVRGAAPHIPLGVGAGVGASEAVHDAGSSLYCACRIWGQWQREQGRQPALATGITRVPYHVCLAARAGHAKP